MSDTIQFDMAEAVAKIAKAEHKKHCTTGMLPAEPQVTMAYVPFQLDKTAYTPEKALQEGTLFTTLNKPFYGRSICNE
jgi:hypothetical protein